MRRSLGAHARSAAAVQVAVNLAKLGLPRPGALVAAYFPMDCELDPAPAVALARQRNCEVLAPVITRFSRRTMRFARTAPNDPVRCNRWGMREPDGPRIHGRWLDLVLVPCVAFDGSGGRLGMGAGFYDRHFSFLLSRHAWRRPRLLGLAYECQRLPALEQQPWDVPLWGIVTERGVYGRAAALNTSNFEEDPG